MIDVVVTPEFAKQYRELPAGIRKKAKKQEISFRNNPSHPSLRAEKLEPKSQALWSFRIDKQYRIIFRFLDGKTVLFLGVGPHQRIYKFSF